MVYLAAALVIALMMTLYATAPAFFFIALPVFRVLTAQTTAVELFDLGGATVTPNEFVGGATFLIAIYCFLMNARRQVASRHVKPIFYVLAIFGGWCVLVSLVSVQPVSRLIETSKILAWMLLVPVVGLFIDTPTRLTALKKAGILSFVITVSHLVVANILAIGPNVSDFYVLSTKTAYIGYFARPAELSLTIATAAILVLIRTRRKKRMLQPTQWWEFGIIIVGVVAIAALMVRTPLIVLMSTVLAILVLDSTQVMQKRRARAMIGVFLAVGSLGGVYVAARYHDVLTERFRDVTKAVEQKEARTIGSGRVGLLEDYLDMLERRGFVHLVTGIDVTEALSASTDPRIGAHNDLVDVTVKYGLIGVVGYIAFWSLVARRIIKRWKMVKEPGKKNLLSVALGLLIAYAMLVFHGMLFYQFPMTCVAIVLGIALGPLGVDEPAFAKKSGSKVRLGIQQ